LLEAYGIVTKDKIPIDTLNPKICPNCNEGNVQDAKFCAKCRMVLTYDAYNETVEGQKEKEYEVQNLNLAVFLFDLSYASANKIWNRFFIYIIRIKFLC